MCDNDDFDAMNYAQRAALSRRQFGALTVAIAASDDKQQPDAKTVLREAFAKAQLRAEIEVYAGTMHGWCALDSRVYNHDQAEKAWARQLVLLKRALA